MAASLADHVQSASHAERASFGMLALRVLHHLRCTGHTPKKQKAF